MGLVIASKTLVSGSEKMAILDRQNYFQRQTNLPADWKVCRVGMIISFTTVAADNATIAAESTSATVGVKSEVVFGLSNGSGVPGDTGNKCLLWAGESDGLDQLEFTSPNWNLKGKFRTAATGNGTTIARVSGGAVNTKPSFGVPENTSGFAVGLVIQFNCATANSLTASIGFSLNTSSIDAAALANLLANTSLSTSSATGSKWWDNTGSNPVACSYFYAHSPFFNHRMRIHNYGVLQLA